MSLKMILSIMVGTLLLTACGGRGGGGQMPPRNAASTGREGVQAPVQREAVAPGSAPAANLPGNLPVAGVAPVNVGGREGPRAGGALQQGQRTGGANLPAQPGAGSAQLPGGGNAGSYEAQEMITAFAAEHLGLALTSVVAGAKDAEVSMPAPAESEMAATVALAGEVAAGVVTTQGGVGAAQVAVGAGTISGDLTADIDSASMGAFSLLLQSAGAPGSEQEALSLILATYPKLAGAALALESSDQGYVFKAVVTEQNVNAQEKEALVVAQVVVAGVMAQGPKPLVWALVANGTFAAALELPF